jgi:hypothetical protein
MKREEKKVKIRKAKTRRITSSLTSANGAAVYATPTGELQANTFYKRNKQNNSLKRRH